MACATMGPMGPRARGLLALLVTLAVLASCGTGEDDTEESGPTGPPTSVAADDVGALDEAHPAKAALPFAERVAEIGRVEVDGQTWILSELPQSTRQYLVNSRLAGPGLDPLGGEVLHVDGEVIVRSVSLNAFPPSFIESDGSSVYAGRHGDGGYPDSALIRIDVETGAVDRIVFPFGPRPDPDPGPEWSIGSEDQFELFASGAHAAVFDEQPGG